MLDSTLHEMKTLFPDEERDPDDPRNSAGYIFALDAYGNCGASTMVEDTGTLNEYLDVEPTSWIDAFVATSSVVQIDVDDETTQNVPVVIYVGRYLFGVMVKTGDWDEGLTASLAPMFNVFAAPLVGQEVPSD
jgi:hypothetical protein